MAKVEAWESSDGSIYRTEDEANEADLIYRIRYNVFMFLERCGFNNGDEFTSTYWGIEKLIRNRAALITILQDRINEETESRGLDNIAEKEEHSNCLIAKFMNWEYDTELGGYTTDHQQVMYINGKPESVCTLRPEEMEFSTSWDWLIPVVRMIAFTCEESRIYDNLQLPTQFFGSLGLHSDIAAVYDAVVNYIKWHSND